MIEFSHNSPISIIKNPFGNKETALPPPSIDRIEVPRFNAFPLSDIHERRGGVNSANASKTTREPRNKAQTTGNVRDMPYTTNNVNH